MIIRVGLGSCGIASGGRKVIAALEAKREELGLDYKIETTGCIGMCFYEPIVDVITEEGSVTYGHVDAAMAEKIAEEHLQKGNVLEENVIYTSEKEAAYTKKQVKIALEGCGTINPEKIEDYMGMDGYKGIEKAIKEMTPEEVIEEIKESGLRGRGGAGFPTWFKWNAALQAKGNKKYMVCNADEGDPGAFMDRSVLEGNPHRLIEGMMIGGYAIGADEGIIYCRAEYPLAIERLEIAMEQARENNLLGENIMGTGFNFSLRIKKGAGAFVCGEETALIESLEGKRGMPRLKPPFPAQSGYWKEPTNINNVETLANVPWIITKGAGAYAEIG
ncbi:Respiratory-chain NADH dehydrogenase subunit, partial [Dethiosulfatibacter aminovorans DSM 17477]